MSSPSLTLPLEVKDMPCQECGALMKCKWSRRYNRFFYGCSKWPACKHTFDAEQITGAPLPGNDGRPLPPGHYTSKAWTAGHPEDFTSQLPVTPGQPVRALWRHVLDDAFLSEPLEVMPEAFPDNVPVNFPSWRPGRSGRR